MKGIRMKRTLALLTALVCIATTTALAEPEFVVSDLLVKGNIEGENIVFDLSFSVETSKRNVTVPLVAGDVAHLESEFPRKSVLSRRGNTFFVKIPSRGKKTVSFRFASNAVKDGAWRNTSFAIPASSIRKLAVSCDREDLEIVFPGALSVEKGKTKAGLKEVTAYLGLSQSFAVRWKPTVKKLTGELVVACDANTIASASVGVLKMDNLFTYRVVQGTLKELTLDLPEGVNITQVRGTDIQDWTIEKKGNKRLLAVTLGRPKESIYKLQVESEVVLPKLPCELGLPVVTPQDVIRSSGFLVLGTDSAIKLLVNKALGLTQVDQSAFPVMKLDDGPTSLRRLPSRSRFAYQYANMPYLVALSADDIVPEYSADDRLVLSVEDTDLVLAGSIELDIRDAPAREITIETEPGWVVANVSGASLSDYDVRDEKDKRLITVYFRDAIMGRTVINVRLENSISADKNTFKAPHLTVSGAKSERGYIMLAAEKGMRLKEDKIKGLREVQTGTVETRIEGAQLAYRFKETGWDLSVQLERTKPTIHSEVFHIVSIGEGALYCSAAISYLVEGAPVRTFKVVIPEEFQNVEFVGRDIRGWAHDGEIWTVSLQEKVIGDYVLGFTYDKQFSYKDKSMTAGGVRTVNTSTEAGYVVLASSANLKLNLEEIKGNPIIPIKPQEVPRAYALLVNDPILAAYKYTKQPHTALATVKRFDMEQLLNQVAEYTKLTTTISKDGEAVTLMKSSIKNLSEQYLELTLPEGAALWSAKYIDHQGRKHDLPPVKKDGKRLIPLRRLTDPNIPVEIELEYAQSMKELGILSRKLTFIAPMSTRTHMTFAEWDFIMPTDYTVAELDGNMTAESMPWSRGIVTVLTNILSIYRVSLTGLTGWVFLDFAILVTACLLCYACGTKRGLIWQSIVSAFVLTTILIIVLVSQYGHNRYALRTVGSILCETPPTPCQITVSKTVSLASTEPLTVSLCAVPTWVGPNGSLVMAIVAIAIGGWLLIKALAHKKQKLGMAAFSLTIMTVGVAQLASGRMILTSVLAVGLPLGFAIALARFFYKRGLARRNLLATSPDMGAPFDYIPIQDEPEPTNEPENGDAGRAIVPLLGLIALLGLGMTATARSIAPTPPPSTPVMDSIEMTITAPAMNEEAERSANIEAVLKFKLDSRRSFVILRHPAVLTEYKVSSRDLSIRPSAMGYLLESDDDGTYDVMLKFSVPVMEHNGEWQLGANVLPNLKNKITLLIPEKELDVVAHGAVLSKTTEKEDGVTETVAIYGSAPRAQISWRPRARKTKLEKVVFSSQANTLAMFRPGVVDMTSVVRYQIAQGELKTLKLTVPANMSVTAVNAKGLSTWRFDPDTRILEAILEKPVSGDFAMVVNTQIGREGLPYDVTIGSIAVVDSARQRGSIALAVPGTVQVNVSDTKGFNSMNIEDVPATATAIATQRDRGRRPTIKRAFRYHDVPVSAKVHAERVLPDIRVVENGGLDVSNERIMLATKLNVNVSKAGVFSLRLMLPADFDVEKVTGPGISHWDELGPEDSGKKDQRAVIVHFKKQALGKREINIVATRTKKGIGAALDVPRITVENSIKHTGTLTVSGEQGVRMTTVDKKGVSEINPRELNIRDTGVLAFRLLRPDWLVRLKAEIVSPTIRTEVLQRVDISEGMMQGAAYLKYRIDHAGSKTFQIQSPSPGIPLEVQGTDVAKIEEIDIEKGIWEVTLHRKVTKTYGMQITYQVPFDSTIARVLPIRTLGVESQKGHLVIMSNGRVQINPLAAAAGLKPEGARSIPDHFNAGDLSDAIYCYRTVTSDYGLELSVVRHKDAEVLAARVNSVDLVSVVSPGGQILTRALLNMDVGNLPVLEITLPAENCKLWSAFVKGKPASVSKDGDLYRIPLEDPVPGESMAIELVYAGEPQSRLFSKRQTYRGPKVGLPLSNIRWSLYVVPGPRYHGFDGTLEHIDSKEPPVEAFDRQIYSANNLRFIEGNKLEAVRRMEEARQLASKGRQKQAKKALKTAMIYSQNDRDFNEDARIQYKNLSEQQAVVGLMQRRNKMRFSRNIQDAGQVKQMQEFKGGNYTAEYAESVQKSLSARERTSLRKLAQRIQEQQEAAQREAQAITITVPKHGLKLEFERILQNNPMADMEVSFKASSGKGTKFMTSILAALFFMLIYRLAMGRKKDMTDC